jgi:hypothetical protein
MGRSLCVIEHTLNLRTGVLVRGQREERRKCGDGSRD